MTTENKIILRIDAEKYFYRIIFFVIICFAAYVRIRLASAPLMRDEGEFAYGGWLAMRGIPPYSMLYNMKLPGIYWFYSLIMSIFGQTDTGLRIGLFFVNIISALLVFSAGKKLFNEKAGLAAASCFVVLGLSRSVSGLYFGAEHVVVLFSLAGIRLLMESFGKNGKLLYFLSGIFFGLSFVTRQHGVYFIFVSLVYFGIVNSQKGLRFATATGAVFLAGITLPVAAMLAYLFFSGVFDNFIFWVCNYGMKYVTDVSPANAWKFFNMYFSFIFMQLWPLFVTVFIGVLLTFFFREKRRETAMIMLWLLTSFAAVSTGFYFRPHYFIYMLPPFAVLCGAAVYYLESLKSAGFVKMILRLIFLLALVFPVYMDRGMYFRDSPDIVFTYSYMGNFFKEIKEISGDIMKLTGPNDTVAVMGSEPEVFFYAKRLSATGYIYMYPLMESHDYAGGMQQQAIQQIEKAKPEVMVLVNNRASWSVSEQSDTHIFEWMDSYFNRYYRMEGTADVLSPVKTEYMWGKEIKDRDYKKPNRITVFKRVKP